MDKVIENLGQIFDLLKSNFLKISLSFAIFSWLVILLPPALFQSLKVSDMRGTYIGIIGAMALVATYLVVLWVGNRILSVIYSYLRARFELPRLTRRECKRLLQFVTERSRTSTFFQTDGVIEELEKKGFVYKSRAAANAGGEQDYHMYSWVYARLLKDPSILEPKMSGGTKHGK